MLYRLGASAIEMANFTAAAFVGAAAAAALSLGALPRWLGWASAATALALLANGPVQVLTDDAANAISIPVFLLFLAWVFVTSVVLTRTALRPAEAFKSPVSSE